jgi:hypothetical protein
MSKPLGTYEMLRGCTPSGPPFVSLQFRRFALVTEHNVIQARCVRSSRSARRLRLGVERPKECRKREMVPAPDEGLERGEKRRARAKLYRSHLKPQPLIPSWSGPQNKIIFQF